MVRSLWTAATGMNAQQTNVDTISNNLANVNSVGYKAHGGAVQVSSVPDPSVSGDNGKRRAETDFLPGGIGSQNLLD